MIKFAKIACLIGMYAIFIRAEAEYLDPSFEINTAGYLYNIGRKEYIGISSLNNVELTTVKNPTKALRLRAYLNENQSDPTIVFLEDKNIPIPEKPGLFMKEKDLYKQRGIKVCSDSIRNQVIIDKYNGSYKFGLFVTPPVLLNENSFYLKKGSHCISADMYSGKLIGVGCQYFKTKYRNNQLFSWVDVNTYNRGIDPVTYRPLPIEEKSDEYNERSAPSEYNKKKELHSLKHAHLTSPSSLPYGNPYRM